MKKREIIIIAKAADKTVEFWADGTLKFKDTYSYGDYAISAAHALAGQYAHHEPVVQLDMRSA